jgi:NADH pyrophosphatase NudC (nudix superfamily)
MKTASGTHKFCIECGGSLAAKWNDLERLQRMTCQRCGAIAYDSPKILVWCLAHCGETFLLCKRAIEPAKGLWNPPAGFVEAGESLEEAMARELSEETGVNLPVSRFILYRVASLPHMNQVYVGFRVELATQPVLCPGPESLEVEFFSENTLPSDQLAFADMVPDTPADIFRRLRNRDFVVQSLTFRPTATSPST